MHSKKVKIEYQNLKKDWDNFNVIYKVPANGVSSLGQYIQAIDNYANASGQNKNINFVFRGEGETYTSYLLPKIYREYKTFTQFKKGWNLTEQEVSEILRFKKSQGGIQYRKNLYIDSVDWLPLAQHYGFATRLLDISYSALVALYFACVDTALYNRDGWVSMFDIAHLRAQKKPLKNVDKWDIEQGIPNSFYRIYEPNELNSVNKDTLHLFKLLESVRLKIVHKRIIAQYGGFLWWHPMTQTTAQNKGIPRFILIHRDAKKKMKRDLDIIFNINDETLFSLDRDIESQRLLLERMHSYGRLFRQKYF